MSEIITTFQDWPERLRLERGLLNGERIKMAREVRGMTCAALARKLSLPTALLTEREQGWYFWEDNEQQGLAYFTDFPVAFFAQDDPPAFPPAPTFWCGTHEDGSTWCQRTEQGELPRLEV